MDLSNIYSNLKSLNVVDLAVDVLEDMEDFIADLNRNQMIDKGQRSDGSALSPDYENITKDIKSRQSGKSSIIDHVTLYDTGALHESIFASITVDELILDSNDNKVDELTSKYGEFLGLSPESIKKLQEKFTPIFLKRLNDKIFG